MRSTRVLFGIAAALLLAVSAVAHAAVGWPQLRTALETAGLGPELLGPVAIGWWFGSVAMAIFAVIVLRAALRVAGGEASAASPTRPIALGYLAFGLAAYVGRGFAPHFLLFVATGVLVGLFGYLRR